MPLNLGTGAQLVAAQEFQYRVAMAFYFVARQVFEEDPATYGHPYRVSFARSIILQDYTQFMQYAAVVATDGDIVAGGPYTNPATQPGDQVIIDSITAIWDKLASVQPA